MTDELRDYTATPGWTRADTDRLLDVALARPDDLTDGEFLNAAAQAEDHISMHGYTSIDEARDTIADHLRRARYKYAPAYTPRVAPANVSPYWHGPQPATMICYSGTALDAVMQGRHDGGDWYNAYCERYRHAHPVSARDFAASCGLTGAAADMFVEIAGIIQNARETTPW